MEKGHTILIIDDNPVNGKLLQTLLKRGGYQTLQAETGADGRMLAQVHSPDLIFLDIIMPDEDGFETCGALKLNPKTARIPVIFLSSLQEPEEKVRGFDLGAVDYITKPYNQEELLARARLHIRLTQNPGAPAATPEAVARHLREFREAGSRLPIARRAARAVTRQKPVATTTLHRAPATSPDHKKVIVHPGEYFVTNEKATIRTVLGSCVAACLWDPSTGVVGMNHFLLTDRARREDLSFSHTEAGKYGVYAMELLINAMIQLGARRSGLRAKVFGGGALINSDNPDSFFGVGEENSRFIIEFLKIEGIPLVSADLRGNFARVIYFNSEDFTVYVRRIGKTGQARVAAEERIYWKTTRESQGKTEQEPELWI